MFHRSMTIFFAFNSYATMLMLCCGLIYYRRFRAVQPECDCRSISFGQNSGKRSLFFCCHRLDRRFLSAMATKRVRERETSFWVYKRQPFTRLHLREMHHRHALQCALTVPMHTRTALVVSPCEWFADGQPTRIQKWQRNRRSRRRWRKIQFSLNTMRFYRFEWTHSR